MIALRHCLPRRRTPKCSASRNHDTTDSGIDRFMVNVFLLKPTTEREENLFFTYLRSSFARDALATGALVITTGPKAVMADNVRRKECGIR